MSDLMLYAENGLRECDAEVIRPLIEVCAIFVLMKWSQFYADRFLVLF